MVTQQDIWVVELAALLRVHPYTVKNLSVSAACTGWARGDKKSPRKVYDIDNVLAILSAQSDRPVSRDDLGELITSEEVEQVLADAGAARGQHTIATWRHRGIGPKAIKLSRSCRRYVRSEVEAWAKAIPPVEEVAKLIGKQTLPRDWSAPARPTDKPNLGLANGPNGSASVSVGGAGGCVLFSISKGVCKPL